MTKFVKIYTDKEDVILNTQHISMLDYHYRKNEKGDKVRDFGVYTTIPDTYNGGFKCYRAYSIDDADELDEAHLTPPGQRVVVPASPGHKAHFFAYSYSKRNTRENTVEDGYFMYQTAPMLAWLIDANSPTTPSPVTTPMALAFDMHDSSDTVRRFTLIEYPNGQLVDENGNEAASVPEWLQEVMKRHSITNELFDNLGDDLPTLKPTSVNVRKPDDAIAAQNVLKELQKKKNSEKINLR